MPLNLHLKMVKAVNFILTLLQFIKLVLPLHFSFPTNENCHSSDPVSFEYFSMSLSFIHHILSIPQSYRVFFQNISHNHPCLSIYEVLVQALTSHLNSSNKIYFIRFTLYLVFTHLDLLSSIQYITTKSAIS